MATEIKKEEEPGKEVMANEPKSKAKKYRYIGPVGAEKLLIPGTIRSVLVKEVTTEELDAMWEQSPGIQQLYEKLA